MCFIPSLDGWQVGSASGQVPSPLPEPQEGFQCDYRSNSFVCQTAPVPPHVRENPPSLTHCKHGVKHPVVRRWFFASITHGRHAASKPLRLATVRGLLLLNGSRGAGWPTPGLQRRPDELGMGQSRPLALPSAPPCSGPWAGSGAQAVPLPEPGPRDSQACKALRCGPRVKAAPSGSCSAPIWSCDAGEPVYYVTSNSVVVKKARNALQRALL